MILLSGVFLRNLVKLICVIALIATIGFSFISCNSITKIDDENYNLDGTTWIRNVTLGGLTIFQVFEFKRTHVIVTNYIGGVAISGEGTYYVTGNNVTLTINSNRSTGTLSDNILTIDGMEYTKQ